MRHFLKCFFLLLFLSGCVATEYNLATNKEETLLFDTEKEIKVGDSISRQLEAKYKIVTDIDINERVQKIAERIVEVCDRNDVVYIVKVIEGKDLNAVSLPGGYIYLFKGMVDKIKTDDALAGVVAHEVGHITARHAMKRMQASYGATVLQVLAGASGRGDILSGVNIMLASVFMAYSRQDEFEADRLAVKYTEKAGYDPKGMLAVIDLLREEQKKAPRRQLILFRTHPYLNERRAALNREISGELYFDDYLDLIGTEGY